MFNQHVLVISTNIYFDVITGDFFFGHNLVTL